MTPELITFCCPTCSKEIKVAKDQNPIGKNILCSGCSTVITLSEQLIKKPAELITFICPHCQRGAVVEKRPDIFGKQMKCKGCEQVFTLDVSRLEENVAKNEPSLDEDDAKEFHQSLVVIK